VVTVLSVPMLYVTEIQRLDLREDAMTITGWAS
jgi:hypothetical protein